MLKRVGQSQEYETAQYIDSIPDMMEMDRYTTFYLKTAMFWLCEEAPPLFWAESGLLFSVKTLLKKFKGYVERQNLPNYFAPQQNLLFQIRERQCDIF